MTFLLCCLIIMNNTYMLLGVIIFCFLDCYHCKLATPTLCWPIKTPVGYEILKSFVIKRLSTIHNLYMSV
jgi:hypothetical protein